MRFHSTWLVLSFVCFACGDDGAPAGHDAGRRDGGRADGGSRDGGSSSDGGADGGAADTGTSIDAAARDAGGTDGGGADAGPPTTCTIDADCPMGFFCRDAEGGGRVCHRFAGEGESCGGFRPPTAIERCEPELECMARSPLIADAPGTCVIAVTVEELAADPTSYDGHAIGILDGWVANGPIACTRIACPPEMPCCNMCNATEEFRDSMTSTGGIAMRAPGGMMYGCMGDNCTPLAACTVEPNLGYRLIGTFHAADGGYVEVITLERTSF
jgi:hypothetical protein